jgi:hypothetical protein
MKIHLRYKNGLVLFMLLLPLLHSCTVQKRLYRPGFYVERHSDRAERVSAETASEARTEIKTEARAETEVSVAVVNSNIAENKQPLKMAGTAAPWVAAHQEVKDVAVKKAPVLKRIAAAPKQLRKQLVKKTWSHAKITEDQGYTIAIIGGIVLLVILAIIGYSIGDPLLVLKVIVIGWYILQALAALAVLGLLIYGIWWLFDFMDGGCGF